ncbi:hypothetical protein DTX80_17480 [Bacilli bacterium]|uniref:hypothetical protein n=1 Tax=Oceanobacillus TaxID=182709 RepID=UPI0006221F7A|nr:hypothetical protein WH51_14155 [Bacilli bacterium VT-13-104]PZD83263.1 hypothetical protein DEJ64_15455 [Bacilli bacterium]PZD84447.1 hypothetical protein DEJ60_14535 [Bacilli bacterium]PZD86685.1 hypothetical protein DEJ66_15195 [Bacilli bacterium]RCO04327.1 hypothetical protein DTX80_17480 [Bacilli bacterium]
MDNNVKVPHSLISFLLDIREERKYNMMLHSRDIINDYLKSDNCDEEGRNFLFENNQFNLKNYISAQRELMTYSIIK